MDLCEIFDNLIFSPKIWFKYLLPQKFSKCTICYNKLYKSSKTLLCSQCKKCFHYKCMNNWYKHNNSLPCPMCRNNEWYLF
jgi:hypothetical protein